MTEKKPEIILTRGLPASGKSTWAKAEARATDSLRVCRDDIRLMMFGQQSGGAVDEGLVTKVETDLVKRGLAQGKDVIVDAQHLPQRYINRWQRLGHPVRIVEFPVPLDELQWRNSRRGYTVPQSYIGAQFQKFTTNGEGSLVSVKLDPDSYRTDGFEKYVQDWHLPSAYIFDIDGTLAHMDGRRSPYDYSKVAGDSVDQDVLEVLRSLEMHHRIIIVSGREDGCRGETEDWLQKNGVPTDRVFMREAKDQRPDTVVKHEILMRDIAPKFNVMGVFDDRNSVVEMWRNVGVKCFQVQEGDF